MIDAKKLTNNIIDQNGYPNESYIETLEKKVRLLTRYIDEIEQDNLKLIEEMKSVLKENEDLKKELRIHDNPHTPSSARRFADSKAKKDVKKRGAPKGHKGATRKLRDPDEVMNVTANICPNCGEDPGESYATETKTIEEMPPPQEIIVKQFNLSKYKCKNCSHKFKTKHKECPQEGRIGPYLLVYMVIIKFFLRSTIRKSVDFLRNYDNFEITPAGFLKAINRVGRSCKTEYDKIKNRIRNSKWVHVDETGMKVNGENWWLWCFRSDSDDVLIDIQDSRGSKVPKAILGEDWSKPTITDGWSAYNWIKIQQRCWAHLLREVDEHSDKYKIAKKLSEDIHLKFKKLREFIDSNKSMEERMNQKNKWDQEMEELVEKYRNNKAIEGKVGYIRNGLRNWYTCLLYPGTEPTNNLGEQALRESVIFRKIIGTFRSEKGAEYYQYIASLLATWRFQGKNMFAELERIVRENLCLK